MVKVLITGINSLLGAGLINQQPKGYLVSGTWHLTQPNWITKSIKLNKLDITHHKQVNKILTDFKPQLVIHAAAMSDVDFCEKNQDFTFQVNIQGLKNILTVCKRIKAKLIFPSTNAVFDGIKPPFSELSRPHPLNYYGLTKFRGEQLIKRSQIPFAVTRLTTMFGWNPPLTRLNPVTWMLKLLTEKQKLYMVNDNFINPLYNLQAGNAIWKIVEKNLTGMFNIAGKDQVNRFQWAKLTAKVFGFGKENIVEVTSDHFPYLTERPVNASLLTAKMQQVLKVKPLNLRQALKHMKDNPLNKLFS